jgi:hypothetical protein
MADDLGDARRELARASQAASDAMMKLREKKLAAQADGDQEAAARYQAAYIKARRADRSATESLQASLVNPTGDKVAKLSDAIKELNDRIERLRQTEAQLNAVAQAIGLLTTAIKAFLPG